MQRTLLGGLFLLSLLGACGLGGQSIEEVDPNTLPQTITYSEHVRPLMEYYCVACHNENSVLGAEAGVDLTSFENVRDNWADSLGVIEGRFMPPGGAQQLTSRDVAIFSRWGGDGDPTAPGNFLP